MRPSPIFAEPNTAAPQQVYAECSPSDQLRDPGQVQPEVDQVERRQPRVERDGLRGQVEQYRFDELEDRGVCAEPERHREHDGDLDAQRAPVGFGQLLGPAHRSYGSGRSTPKLPSGAPARSPLRNGQPINIRIAWLSPVTSSTGLVNANRTS